MSEEKAVDLSEQESQEQSQEPQLTEVEQQALAEGWKPKEDFEADPNNKGKKWRSAELFLELTPIFSKIDALSRENKNLERGLKAFSEHNAKIEAAAFERAKKELQEQRKAAIEEEDFKKAEHLRDDLEALKEEHQQKQAQAKAQEVVNAPPQEFVEWVSNNEWYNTDQQLRREADVYGRGLAAEGIPANEVLKMVSRKMKELFPGKFRNPNKDTASGLESSSKKSSERDSFRLTADEERIMSNMLRAGVPSPNDPNKLMTREEYVSQLKKARG